MRLIASLFLCLLATMGLPAQKLQEELKTDYKGFCVVSFPKTQLTNSSQQCVEAYLIKTVTNLQNKNVGVKLNYRQESPGGVHLSFIQLYKGVEVYQSEVKVNLDRKNVVHSVFDNSYNTEFWQLEVDGATLHGVIAIHSSTGLPVLAERKLDKGIEKIIAENEVLYERDTRSYFAPDSLVSAKVFNPDPLTTIQQAYAPGNFDDNNDANSTWLNNQLTTVSFSTDFNGSEFRLENSYIKIVDVDSPNVLPVVSSTPQFYFNRSQTGFEDVNAFYHLNRYRDYVHQLGFDLADHFVLVDAHAWSGNDQSSFSPNGGNPELDFGVGGVDDAEDADVLVHEYAHFISYNAAPGSNVGSQRNSLDEAFGDYAAASYSNSISTYNKDWVFNWDGPIWSGNNSGGRTVASTKVYPTDLTGSIYKNAPIWSTALMNIHNEIGRAATDSLIYQTHFSYAANITMADAAQLLIDADTLLNNGAYYCPIYKSLLNRGLVAFYSGNPCGISSIQDEAPLPVTFTQSPSGFTIFSTAVQNTTLMVYSLSGQQLYSERVGDFPFSFRNSNLPNGVYLVEFKTSDAEKTFKWIKAE